MDFFYDFVRQKNDKFDRFSDIFSSLFLPCFLKKAKNREYRESVSNKSLNSWFLTAFVSVERHKFEPLKLCVMETKIHNFSTAFYLRKDQTSKEGKSMIILRIFLNGEYAKQSTKLKINPCYWDEEKYRVKPKAPNQKEINDKLDEIEVAVKKTFKRLELTDNLVTADKVKKFFLGENISNYTLFEVFDKFLENFRKQVYESKNKTKATLIKYECTYNRLKNFLKDKRKRTDIALNEINHEFLVDFEVYLRTKAKCGTNTVIKFMAQLKTIILMAHKNDWIAKNPFCNYELKKIPTKPRFINRAELKRIEQKNFNIERLDRVKDYFLFACYTGLSYIDIKNLKWMDIYTGENGEIWIDTKRIKTGVTAIIPLLNVAVELLNKYKPELEANPNDFVFPVPANQVVNSYLKEIGSLCGISKQLTFHVARHNAFSYELEMNWLRK